MTGVLVGIVTILWLTIPKTIDYLLKQPTESGAHELGLSLQQSMTGWLSPFHAFMIPVFGTLTILFVGLLVSAGSKPIEK